MKETYSFSHLPKYERRKSSIRAPFQGRGGSFFLSLVFRPAVWLSSSSVVYLRATSRRDRIDIVHNSRRAPVQGRTKGPQPRDYFTLGEAVGKPLLASPKMRKINMAWTVTFRIWKYRAPCYTAKLPRALNKTKSCIYPGWRIGHANWIQYDYFPLLGFFLQKSYQHSPRFSLVFFEHYLVTSILGYTVGVTKKDALSITGCVRQEISIAAFTFAHSIIMPYVYTVLCILYIV